MLNINDKIDNFKLIGSDNKEHELKEYSGEKIVLYFYPKDLTSGCTIEANKFNSLLEEFHKFNAIVIGVSKDNLKSHDKFINKNCLNFLLLSDEDCSLAKYFDAYGEKSMYGKKYFGIIRSTFIIDENQTLIYAQRKVNPSKNPEEVLNFLRNL